MAAVREEVAMIRWMWAFIDRPVERFEEGTAFWAAVTGAGSVEPWGDHGEFATLCPPAGDPYLAVQRVGGAGGAHFDLEVEDVPAAVGRARDLGAAVAGEFPRWTVMRSPGGLPFCFVRWRGAAGRPPVALGPDGAASRLDQVCLDLGPAIYDAEVAFWTELTGWEPRSTDVPEFRRLRPAPELPLQFLLQRLGEDRPASCHLDLACSDVDAVRARHEEHGARALDRRPGWTVMRDPSGGIHCLTARDPELGPAARPPS